MPAPDAVALVFVGLLALTVSLLVILEAERFVERWTLRTGGTTPPRPCSGWW